MKKIEIKDLIIGEVYFKNNFIFKHVNTNPYLCDNYAVYGLDNTYYHGNGHMKDYNKFPQRLATSEEKHWLEVCIAANSFISYNEAIKTFIPEYVEAIQQSDGYTIGKIYKTLSDSTKEWYKNIDDENRENGWSYLNFKPSTKEAYDAQFVVKEPEFVLPDEWCVKVTNKNKDILLNFINSKVTSKRIFENIYDLYIGKVNNPVPGVLIQNNYFCYAGNLNIKEITFEQFKKYVLKEQLEEPKDKVLNFQYNNLPNIEKVQCSEGAVYKLGDKITVFTKNSPNKGKPFTIKSFRWNNAKTNICAITELHTPNGIGLDKIELYLEPKVKQPLFTTEQVKQIENIIKNYIK